MAYRIRPTEKFEGSYKQLLKSHYKKNPTSKKAFEAFVTEIVARLATAPAVAGSRVESWPIGAQKSGCEFRKLLFSMPGQSGAASKGRLIYVVDNNDNTITLLWIYTHKEFAKRPPDKALKTLIKEAEERAASENEDAGVKAAPRRSHSSKARNK